MMERLNNEQILALVKQHNARDEQRAFASARLAIRCGDDPNEVIAALKRNAPHLWGEPKLAMQATALPHWETPKGEPRKKQFEDRREARWQ
jgi:hypothetical protein